MHIIPRPVYVGGCQIIAFVQVRTLEEGDVLFAGTFKRTTVSAVFGGSNIPVFEPVGHLEYMGIFASPRSLDRSSLKKSTTVKQEIVGEGDWSAIPGPKEQRR